MTLGPRHRAALGALGVGLATAVAIAAPWLMQPAYVFFASAALLGAAAAWLFVLMARTAAPAGATDESAAQVLAPQVRAPIDDDLRVQLETLRRTQGELIVAKQASEAAMLAKDEFLATMSHEIRTPLNGVLPLIELVLSTPLSDEQRDHLGTAYRSAQEMLRIVDDILDYSKLDVGKLEIEHIALNLRELVDGVAQLMRRSAEAKGLRLGVSIDPNVRLAVRGDPVRLRQILMNLVSNAIKFTARGSVTVLVSRRGETPTAHEVAFAVRDTGIGMTAETTAKLFRPFSCSPSPAKARCSGSAYRCSRSSAICRRSVTCAACVHCSSAATKPCCTACKPRCRTCRYRPPLRQARTMRYPSCVPQPRKARAGNTTSSWSTRRNLRRASRRSRAACSAIRCWRMRAWCC
jgi:signal transduction histidine kinase